MCAVVVLWRSFGDRHWLLMRSRLFRANVIKYVASKDLDQDYTGAAILWTTNDYTLGTFTGEIQKIDCEI